MKIILFAECCVGELAYFHQNKLGLF